MACNCSKDSTSSSKVDLRNGRKTCLNCTCKHLGLAWLCSSLNKVEGVTSADLVERAKILHVESLQGYPHHMRFAVACLSLASEALLRVGKNDDAALAKATQKEMEDNPDKLNNITVSAVPLPYPFHGSYVRAHLLEAIEESPYADASAKIRDLLAIVSDRTLDKTEVVIGDIIEVLHRRAKEEKDLILKKQSLEKIIGVI